MKKHWLLISGALLVALLWFRQSNEPLTYYSSRSYVKRANDLIRRGALVFDCRDDSDAMRRMQCNTLVECALANDCSGTPCYCGSTDAITCGFGGANGECRMEVEQAAGPSTDPATILLRNLDPMFALGRASLLGDCAVMQCPDVCP